jgi:hypothetical protein
MKTDWHSYLHESTLFVSDPNRREEYVAESVLENQLPRLTIIRLINETRKLVEMFPNGLDDFEKEVVAPAPMLVTAEQNYI